MRRSASSPAPPSYMACDSACAPLAFSRRRSKPRWVNPRPCSTAPFSACNPAKDPMAPPKGRGDPDAALAAASHRHAGEYYVPIEHHNPMELYASTVFINPDGRLTVHDKTQGVQNVQRYLCGVLGMTADE